MKNKRLHVLVVLGTRPEAIKLAPVIDELRRRKGRFRLTVCATAQHRLLLDQMTELFRIPVDYDLNVMTHNQKLDRLTARILTRIGEVLEDVRPDAVVVQGDTTTTFITSLAAFYRRIPVAHVEAGLRTQDRFAPFPEEVNRRLTSHIADFHFAPTPWARANLRSEGVPAKQIFVTGNTVVDAFLRALQVVRRRPPSIPALRGLNLKGRKLLLVTAHRRENFGRGLENICRALRRIAERRRDVVIVYPVHPNPNVRGVAERMLGGVEGIHLIPPQEYLPFVWLMSKAYLALTDSGGVQEEMPSLHRPVLVMREKTERPEGVQAGVCRLVGTDAARIERAVLRLLDDRHAYGRIRRKPNPFGDGRAARRIVRHLQRLLG